MLQSSSWEGQVDIYATEIKSWKDFDDTVSKNKFTHHRSDESLRQAVDRGCYICEPLWRLVNRRGQTFNKSIYNSMPGGIDLGILIGLVLQVMDDENCSINHFRYYDVLPLKDTAFSTGIPYNLDVRNRLGQIPQATYVGSTQTWINDCLMNHDDCQKSATPKEYPTRLLELHESMIRLITPDKPGFAASYAALSYCWGKKPFKCLKFSDKKNAFRMEEFQQGISLDDLPLVFQEVIGILKSLSFDGASIRYLWIDAYCIIQDSKEDWARECVRMKDVYQNCDICLAIANAEHPDSTPPFEAEAYPSPDRAQKSLIISNEYFRDSLYDQPLGTRGWSLQERLLSPRVLSFGLGELFWDCKQKQNVSESFPLGPDALGTIFTGGDIHRNPLPEKASLQENQTAWAEIVDEYTDRALSFPAQDKLIAISAIASRWQVAMGDAYIAGHFWKTLPTTLNWKIQSFYHQLKNPGVPRHRIQTPIFYDGDETLIAPTWSWASIDGPLTFIDSVERRNRVHDISKKEKDTLAEVIDRKVVRVNDQKLQTSTSTLALTIETFIIPLVGGNPVFKSEASGEFEMYIDDPEVDSKDRSPCILAALVIKVSLRESRMEGLVIQKTDDGDQEEDLYKRIGHFSIDLLSFQPFGDEEIVRLDVALGVLLMEKFLNASWKSIVLV